MASQDSKYSSRKIKSSFFSTIISLSLVLFVLGLLGLVLLNANKLANHVKENIGLNLILRDSVNEADISALRKQLDNTEGIKSVRFVTKEEAAENLQEDLGENFIQFLGYNPLRASFDIKLKAAFANNDSLKVFEQKFFLNPAVKEVSYQKSLVDEVNRNVSKISLVLLIFTALLSIISIALINNSIRLYIYSKRFIIRTMQLVGATQSFISRPFIVRSVLNGFYGSLITIALMMGLIAAAQRSMPELIEIQDIYLFIELFVMVIVAGIGITLISTYFAVKKYLKIQTDELYN